MPNFILRRRNGFYFRARLPAASALRLGKEVVISLRTSDLKTARTRMPNVLKTFRACMDKAYLTDRKDFVEALQQAVLEQVVPSSEPCEHDALQRGAYLMGVFSTPEFQALWKANEQQARRLAAIRSLMKTGELPQPIREWDRSDPADARRWLDEGSRRSQEMATDMGYDVTDAASLQTQGKAWQDYLDEFWKDNPGYAHKSILGMRTTFTYLERVWKRKPLKSIVKRDLVDVADYMRDFVSERNQRPLSHKTIQRQLGEVRSFLRWAVSKDYIRDDGFDQVKPRKKTVEERASPDRRRPFTHAELKRFFRSREFAALEQDDGWWLAVLLAMTGARGGEITKAPSELVMVGKVPCIDLREAGTKTRNASRLVPVIDELRELGFLDYAARQKRRGLPLIHGEGPSGTPRTGQACMTRLNRVIRTVFPYDLDLMGYSFRHHFRQMLSASTIGLELSNKVFGHRGGETYERYGKGLSEAEAQVFVKEVHFPMSLHSLITRNRV